MGYAWAHSHSGAGWYDYGLDATCDGQGNVFICGDYEGPTNIGGTTYPGLGSSDSYTCQIASDGTYNWVTVVGSVATDRNFSIDIGPNQQVYTCGYGKIPYPQAFSRNAMHQWDAITTHIRPNGAVVWGRAMQGDVYSEAYDIVVDAAGNSYTVGQLKTKGWYGTDTLHGHGSTDAFIVKFDSTGQYVWGETFGGNLDDFANSVALDAHGNVWVGGSFIAYAQFDTILVNGTGGSDAFLARLNASDGHVQYVKSYDGPNDAEIIEIATSADGDCYFVGDFTGNANVGGNTINAVDALDIFYGKVNAQGYLQWVQQAGGLDLDIPQDMELDEAENIYIGGFFFGTLAWQTANDTSAAGDNPFFAKTDSNGILELLHVDHSSFGADIFGVGVDPAQNIIVTGSFTDTLHLGANTLVSIASTSDVFVAKYATRTQETAILNVLGTPYCADDQFAVAFQAWGDFGSGNTFFLELSDVNGSFALPQVVGSLPGMYGATIMATIPANILQGTQYRMRIRSTQPATLSPDNGQDITLTPNTSIPVSVVGDTVLCNGQAVLLSVDNAFVSQVWSTGDTTTSISLTVPGLISVEATDVYGCTNRDEVEVVLCMQAERPAGERAIHLSPNPASQWTRLSFEGMKEGIYTVEIVDACGKQCLVGTIHAGASVPIDVGMLVPGLYVMHIFNDATSQNLRLLIQ